MYRKTLRHRAPFSFNRQINTSTEQYTNTNIMLVATVIIEITLQSNVTI